MKPCLFIYLLKNTDTNQYFARRKTGRNHQGNSWTSNICHASIWTNRMGPSAAKSSIRDYSAVKNVDMVILKLEVDINDFTEEK